MSRLALTPVNVPWGAANPTTPTLRAADMYANSGTKKLRVYDGAAWHQVPYEDTANTYTAAQTFNAGLSVPAGQSLVTGTRTVVTGTRATTTNASDTVDLGTFSTTGGAIELRIHAHLAAPVAGTTASVTKVYEIAVAALMGTLNTWYKVLPADVSANQAAANDFALEVQRTAANDFQFRFRQISIGVAGSITFTAETLGDTAVTFTPSTTVTAAPAAVTTLHPSNGLVLAAGAVGIGTDAPASPLHLVSGSTNGTMRVEGTGGRGGSILLSHDAYASQSVLNVEGTLSATFAESSAGDLALVAASGKTLRLGVGGGGASTLRISATEALILDGTLARPIPRGRVTHAEYTTGNVALPHSGSTTLVTTPTMSVVAGHVYLVMASCFGTSAGTAGDNWQFALNFNVVASAAGVFWLAGATTASASYYKSGGVTGTTNADGKVHYAIFVATTSGTCTFNWACNFQSGSAGGTMNVLANANNPINITVIDIGA